jgi:hypothetical protein|uniref:TPR repeat-containing protein n=1 Tax=uncultured bacterium UPO75 TaxID=1776992 RepID=A0A140DZW8_9BACT|nr:TPR repeat-containing protein [uncultured bacterium UPO75]
MIRRDSDGRRLCGWLSLLVVVIVTGCARVETRAPVLPTAAELTATPFFPQRDFECGPAALATVLAASGLPVSADDLSGEVYLPDRRGSLQPEMLATARRHRRIAYPVQGLPDLVAQLQAGSPVVVLQRLGSWPLQTWHYAVVIGFDSGRRELVLRSGTEQRLTLGLDRFLRSWQPGGDWAFVALRPGQLPAQADAERYLAAVAAAESALPVAQRAAAYRAATAAWPALATAHFALGNSLHEQRLDGTAEASWRMAIRLQPGHAGAINNLAELLARSGRRGEALRLLDQSLAGRLDPESLRPVLQQTRQELAGNQSAAARPKKLR